MTRRKTSSIAWRPGLKERLQRFADAKEITVTEAVHRVLDEGLARYEKSPAHTIADALIEVAEEQEKGGAR